MALMMMERENPHFISPGLFFDLSILEENCNNEHSRQSQPKVRAVPVPLYAPSSSDDDVQITDIEFAGSLTPIKKKLAHKMNRVHAGENSKRGRQSDSGLESGESPSVSRPAPPKRMKKKGNFTVKSKEMKSFFRLIDDPLIHEFLISADACKRLADRYILAMVFAYFKRAEFSIREYNRMNFFRALYLANDMEEDEEEYKYEIFPWALGKTWRKKYMDFLRKRDKLWAKLDFRGVVSRKCCDEIMAIEPGHWAWQRQRPEHHAGAIRAYELEDSDQDYYPVGPDSTPKECEQCARFVEYDSASPSSSSFYVSSNSDDTSPELNDQGIAGADLVLAITGSNFEAALPASDIEEIWGHVDD